MNKDASKWRVLDQTMTEACAGFADLPVEEVEALVDEAVTAARETARQLQVRQLMDDRRVSLIRYGHRP